MRKNIFAFLFSVHNAIIVYDVINLLYYNRRKSQQSWKI